ncbi:MAG: uroporphyrinogen-III synthase, partial [Terracidiphilus sp.]
LDEQTNSMPLEGRRVAVQEYGTANNELLEGLAERGAQVTRVPVYQWAFPEDTGPLRRAVETIAHEGVDVALFTTSVQVVHLLELAEEMGLTDDLRRAFNRIVIASIGPVTSEELRRHGLVPDLEPSHPKMGFLVKETAESSAGILGKKREQKGV